MDIAVGIIRNMHVLNSQVLHLNLSNDLVI